MAVENVEYLGSFIYVWYCLLYWGQGFKTYPS